MIGDYQLKLERLKGKRDSIKESISSIETNITKTERDLRNTEDAQIIIQTVAQQTRQA